MKVAQSIPRFSSAQIVEAYALATSPEFDHPAVAVDGFARITTIHSLASITRNPSSEDSQQLCEALTRTVPTLDEAWHAARLNLTASLAGELAIGEEEACERDVREIQAQEPVNASSVNVLRTYTSLRGQTCFRVMRFANADEARGADAETEGWVGVTLNQGDHLIVPGMPRPTVMHLVASLPNKLVETSLEARRMLALVR